MEPQPTVTDAAVRRPVMVPEVGPNLPETCRAFGYLVITDEYLETQHKAASLIRCLS
ncbi:MAG: hypothetical protein ABSB75_00975 [Candidatus Limnocylindrales bacterium]